MQQARPVSSAGPRSVEFPLSEVSLSLLSKTYGSESARAIMHLITEFLPYVANFQPIVGTFKEPATMPGAELGGPPLLFLVCPLLVQCRDGTKSVVVVHVGFPRQYPGSTVTAALAIPSNGRVRDHHPTISNLGVVRVAGLPLLRSAKPPYSLCELLLAITDTCEESFPFVPLAAPVSLSTDSVATPAPPATTTVSAASPAGAATRAGAQVLTGRVAAPAAVAPPPVRPIVRQAAESLIVHLGRMGIPEYLQARESGAAVLQQLQADHDAMTLHLRGTVGPQKESLVELRQSLSALLEMATVSAPRVLQSTKDCVEAADEVAGEVFPLLAELQAQDDLYASDEVLLKKGRISAEEFVKSVSDVARAQFWCRYRFQRLMQRTTSSTSAKADTKASPPTPTTVSTPAALGVPNSPAAVGATCGASVAPAPGVAPVAAQPSRTPVAELVAEFPQLDEGLIEDVFAATKSIPLARSELRAMAGIPS